MKRPSTILAAILGAIILTAAFFQLCHVERTSGRDPDRYYHFALSREMADSGKLFLRELPQVENLGWGKFFVEKEFLFHQFTALGYRLGADNGVVWVAWILAICGPLFFYAYSTSRIGPGMALVFTALFFFSPMLISRLLLLRPHVLAIACFVAMIAGVLSGRRLILFVSVLLFALSYHAFYIPVLVLISLFLAQYLSRSRPDKEVRSLGLWGAAGLLVGILINPYFPANIVSGFQIALIPGLMAGKLSSIGFGAELYPVSSKLFLVGFSLPLLVFLLSIWQMSRDNRAEGSFRFSTLFLAQLCLVCLLMTFQSRRGAEYLIPVSAFLAVTIWGSSQFLNRKKTRMLLAAGLTLAAAWHCWESYHGSKDAGYTIAPDALAAARAIPADRAAKVFNCEWDTTPYLFYARPKLKFLDIMDPSLLYFADDPAHTAREKLKEASTSDAYGLIKNAYKADYVFCRNSDVVSQMERDPNFRRLYPPSINAGSDLPAVFTYELKPEPIQGYTADFTARFIPSTEQNFRQMSPAQADAGAVPLKLTFSKFVDFGVVFEEKEKAAKEGDSLCALISPADMAGLEGATYLSLGGGRNIRMWRNGQPWYRSESAFLHASMHQQVVPLGKPLTKADRLEFVVCSARKAGFWGFSLLGLTEQTFADICRWKRATEAPASVPFNFRYERRHQSCLGEFSVSVTPSALR